MSRSKTSHIKLGLFVTIAIAIFTIAIYYIGNRQYMFGSTFKISSEFSSVKGLKTGNNVRYAGISVGSVDKLTLVNDSLIRVDMVIDKKIQGFIKGDARASISTDGLVGNMIVNISPGAGDFASVDEGDFINSDSGNDTDEILSSLGNVTENIKELTDHLINIADSISNGSGGLSTLINDPGLGEEFRDIVSNLDGTTSNFAAISNQLQTTIDEVQSGEGLLGYLLTDTTLKEQMSHLTEDIDTIINIKISSLIDDLASSAEAISVTSEELERMTKELDLEEGVAGLLLKDSVAADDIRMMLNNLNEGTGRFNESMEALQHNFLLRGFFKKKEKQRKKELERIKKLKEEEAKLARERGVATKNN